MSSHCSCRLIRIGPCCCGGDNDDDGDDVELCSIESHLSLKRMFHDYWMLVLVGLLLML